MEKIKLEDNNCSIISSTMEIACASCLEDCNSESEIYQKCQLKLGKRRRGIKITSDGRVSYCSGSKSSINSSKYFKKEIRLLSESIGHINMLTSEFRSKLNAETDRLLHNIVSLNAHNIQEIHAIIPQSDRRKNHQDVIVDAKKKVEVNSLKVANSLVNMTKNCMSMKIEFSVFNRLFTDNPQIVKRRHNLDKLFASILYVFFPDFREKGIYIVRNSDSFNVDVDYDSMHVVFHHLLENAAKYSLPDEDLHVTISPERRSLKLEMYSLEITDKDMKHIYDEGYSGDYAQLAEKSGKGIGMSRIKKLLAMNDIKIMTERNIEGFRPRVKNQVSYRRNAFTLFF